MGTIGFILLIMSLVVGQRLRSKFIRYSKAKLGLDLLGAEIAAKMLHEHGIDDVQISCTKGHLTDHYNPLTKTVNLSEQVYYGKNVAAAAIAAHECGHAVQHARGYAFLRLRSAMVPAISAAARFMPWIILLGIAVIEVTALPLKIGIALFSLTTLFTLITLPVEFDASQKALGWLNEQRLVSTQGHKMAQDALWWAAMTYVVAAIGSLAQLLHLIFISSQNRDRR